MRIIGLAVFLTASAAAQWLNLPTPGIPRTADGKPELTAPAPKTSGGKPDFSGMWVPRDVLPCDVSERGAQCVELPLTPQLVNFAVGLKNGLHPKVFTKPWTVALHMRPLLDTEMIDFMCQENNKDIGHLVR